MRSSTPWILLSSLVLSCGGENGAQAPADDVSQRVEDVAPHPPLDPAEVAQGRDLYVRYCALCHGPNAEGYAADHANALGNSAFLAIASDEFIRAAIRDGRPGTPMSAWSRRASGPLDDQQIGRLVLYLRSLARRPPIDVSQTRVSGSEQRGGALYAQHCSSCHGAQGQGSEVATSLSHPNFQRTATDGFLRSSIENGRPGTPMPSFGDRFSSQELDDVIAFIRTLERQPEHAEPPPGGPPPPVGSLIIHPQGATPNFELRENRFVAADAVKQALDRGERMIILDARAASDWAGSHIRGAAPFPFYDIEQMTDALPRDGTWILAYCGCPHAASGRVVDTLRSKGFEHTAVIDEGIHYWLDHGYPIERGVVP